MAKEVERIFGNTGCGCIKNHTKEHNSQCARRCIAQCDLWIGTSSLQYEIKNNAIVLPDFKIR